MKYNDSAILAPIYIVDCHAKHLTTSALHLEVVKEKHLIHNALKMFDLWHFKHDWFITL